jgi:hypothetical protein
MRIEQIEKLNGLHELKEKGLMTEDEFQVQKKKVMTTNEIFNEGKHLKDNNDLVIVGYVITILPMFIMPIVFTIIASIVGIININKRKVVHGSAQIGLSVFCGFIGSSGLGI